MKSVKSKHNKNQRPIGNEAERHLGKAVHLADAPSACVWILEKVDGDIAHLITPKTARRRTAQRKDLYSKSF